jgi:hypothetical protein
VAIGHFAPSHADAASDAFVICHGTGDNSPVDQDGPLKQSPDQSHCVLCTLTSSACAVLPLETATATFDASILLRRVPLRDFQVISFNSLTGEYPRGPPTYAHVVG